MSSDNLKKGQPFTKENAAEMGRRGGIASGKAKRKKRSERERFELLMNIPLSKGSVKDLESIRNFESLEGKNLYVGDMIAAQMVQRALSGDREAARMIYNILGQMGQQRDQGEEIEAADDGFLEALGLTAANDWSDGGDG